MVLEYARNVLGFQEAQSQENDPYASRFLKTVVEAAI